MISRTAIKTAAVAVAYHSDTLKKGQGGQEQKSVVEEYYLGGKGPAMTWGGKGAELLGLDGKEVVAKDLLNVLEGKLVDQHTGQIHNLGIKEDGGNVNSRGHRAGWDYTISAPKSFSVAALVGNDKRLIESHERNVKQALQYLEKDAQCRMSKDGQKEYANSGNLTWATVRHDTNRMHEPNLHNHCLIANVTWNKELGRWQALTNDEMVQRQKAADVIYKAGMAADAKEMGYEIVWGKDGSFELKGFAEHNKEFSQRSEEIKAYLTASGLDPATATFEQREAATLATRPAKGEVPAAEAFSKWQEVAKACGLDTAKLQADAARRVEGGVVMANSSEVNKFVAQAISHLSRESTFKSSEVAIEALKFGQEKTLKIDQINAEVDRLKANGTLIDRGLGKGVQGITTRDAVAAENALAKAIVGSIGKATAVVKADEFKQRLGRYEAEAGITLSKGQREAALNALTGRDLVQAIQGVAGSGKTKALQFVGAVAKEKGWDVLGIAPTGTATDLLGKDTGIKSDTLAGFLQDSGRLPKQLGKEIEGLKSQATELQAGKGAGRGSESFKSNFRTLGVGTRQDEYRIDENGNVWRANLGITNIKNTLAAKVRDHYQSEARQAKQDFREAKGFVAAFKAADQWVGNKFVAKTAKENIKWTKCGGIVATAVKTAAAWADHATEKQLTAEIAKKETQLENLQKTGNVDGKKSMLILDEASFISTKDLSKVVRLCIAQERTLIIQGDKNQIPGVEAGAGTLFERIQNILKDNGGKLAVLNESRRFDSANENVKESQRLWLGEVKLSEKEATDVRSYISKEVTSLRVNIDSETLGVKGGSELKVLALDAKQNKITVERQDGSAVTFDPSKMGGELAKITARVAPDRAKAVAVLTMPEISEPDLHAAVAKRYVELENEFKAADPNSTKKVGVVAVTNEDRNGVNAEIHDLRRGDKPEFVKDHSNDVGLTGAQSRHIRSLMDAGVNAFDVVQHSDTLGAGKGAHLTIESFDTKTGDIVAKDAEGRIVKVNVDAENYDALKPVIAEVRAFSEGDVVTARANLGERFAKEINEKGWNVIKKDEFGNEVLNADRVRNGTEGVITSIDKDGAMIRWGDSKEAVRIDNEAMRHVDLGYARTTIKEQGQSNGWELAVVSDKGAHAFGEQIGYVAITRAKEGCEVFCSDVKKMLDAVTVRAEPSMATDIGKLADQQPARTNANVLEKAVDVHESQKYSPTGGAPLEQARINAVKEVYAGSGVAKDVDRKTTSVEGGSKELAEAAGKRYSEIRGEERDALASQIAQAGQDKLSKALVAFASHLAAGPEAKKETQIEQTSGAIPEKTSPGAAHAAEIAEIAKSNAAAADKTWASIVTDRVAEREAIEAKPKLQEPTKIEVVAHSEIDRNAITDVIRRDLKQSGDLDQKDYRKEHLKDPDLSRDEKKDVSKLQTADVDTYIAAKADSNLGVKAGDELKVVAFNAEKNTVTVMTPDGKEKTFDPSKKDEDALKPKVTEVKEFAKGEEVRASENIGAKSKIDEAGKTVANEDRIEKGTKGTIVAIDEKTTTIAWKKGDEIEIKRLDNDQMKNVDHGYTRDRVKDPEKAWCATFDSNAATRYIVAVSDKSISGFQREAGHISGRKDIEILTNCKDKMLEAVGGEKKKPERQERDPERTKERTNKVERQDEPQQRRQRGSDHQREMTM